MVGGDEPRSPHLEPSQSKHGIGCSQHVLSHRPIDAPGYRLVCATPSWRSESRRSPGLAVLDRLLALVRSANSGAGPRGRLSGNAATRERRVDPLVPSFASANSRSRRASPSTRVLARRLQALGAQFGDERIPARLARTRPAPRRDQAHPRHRSLLLDEHPLALVSPAGAANSDSRTRVVPR